MAVVVQPIDASAGAPQYSAQQSRQAFSAHLGGAKGSRPLGAYSGVRPGTPTTTVVLSGAGSTTWTVGAHAGVLDTQTPVAAGPYEYACDGTDTGTLTAANGSNPRIDVIWVTVNDTVQDGSGSRNGTIGYSAGTAAASPAAPTAGQGTPAVPARAMILAQVNVPTSGTGTPTVTWVAPYCVAAGGIRPVPTITLAGTGNYNGEAIVTLDTGIRYWWSTTAAGWLSKPISPPTACRYYCNAAMNLTNGGRTQLTLGGKSFDYSAGGTLVSSNAFTAPEAGLYDVRWRVSANINNNPQDFHSVIASSGFGAEYARGSRVYVRAGTSADTWASVGSDLVPLALGGTIILGANNAGSNIMVVTAGAVETYLSIVKVA